MIRKVISGLICRDFIFSANTDITALGSALLASNNSRFFQRDEIKYLFKKDKQQDYLINKYNKWKKLTNKIINFKW